MQTWKRSSPGVQAPTERAAAISIAAALLTTWLALASHANTGALNSNTPTSQIYRTQTQWPKGVGHSRLEDRTRVIVTHSRRHDGRVQENRGSGVIIGHFFLTAYHNLKPLPVGNFVTTNSYLGGIAIEPEVIDSNADIAIIRVPAALCPSWCTSSDLLPAAEADLAATVRWFRSPATAADGTPGWQQARVTSRTWSLPGSQLQRPSNDCDAGLVLEVDQPFLPGSSGAGVWDANNRLVGIAQGSYQTRDGHLTGYFKPLRCIREHWPTLSSSEP